jgi:arylsulfatase A-like enzyme
MATLNQGNLVRLRFISRLNQTFPFALLAALPLWWAAGEYGLSAEPPRGPNVVLVMTDDQGYGDLACHGNPMIRTPNLDRLHRQSVRLVDFHVDPTCSPTRSALMTGRYSSRTGVWHTIMGRSLLRRDEVTLAEVFSAAGYRTGIFGKWHLGDNYPSRPQDQGFQETLVHGGGGVGQTPDAWGNDYFDDTYWHNGRPEKFNGYCTDVFFDAALKFIQENRERPFFCYLPTNAPHGPYLVAEKYSQPYADRGVPPSMAAFYGMITNIDENVGRLLDRLEEWKLAENTILIFMTDNGTAAGVARAAPPGRRAAGSAVGSGRNSDPSRYAGFNAGMRGQKGSEYEGGHRVPFFVRWPDKFQGGRDVDQLAAHVDVLPTLAELCGLKLPEGVKLDGRSLAPLLRAAGQPAWPERTLVVHSQRIEQPQKWKTCAVMTERWRLINGRELYDIQADPGQTRNLASEHPDEVARLRQAYDAWWEDISARFEEYVEIVLGSPHENPVRLTCHDWHTEQSQVPWNQSMVRQSPRGNGFWAVDVQRAGRYEFILRQQPPKARLPLEAVEARLKIGDVDVTQRVPAGATSVTLEAEVPAGKTRLQTWLISKDAQSRGAFFVYARHID